MVDKGSTDNDYMLVSTDEQEHLGESYKVIRIVLLDHNQSNTSNDRDLRLKFYIILVSADQGLSK